MYALPMRTGGDGVGFRVQGSGLALEFGFGFGLRLDTPKTGAFGVDKG